MELKDEIALTLEEIREHEAQVNLQFEQLRNERDRALRDAGEAREVAETAAAKAAAVRDEVLLAVEAKVQRLEQERDDLACRLEQLEKAAGDAVTRLSDIAQDGDFDVYSWAGYIKEQLERAL